VARQLHKHRQPSSSTSCLEGFVVFARRGMFKYGILCPATWLKGEFTVEPDTVNIRTDPVFQRLTEQNSVIQVFQGRISLCQTINSGITFVS